MWMRWPAFNHSLQTIIWNPWTVRAKGSNNICTKEQTWAVRSHPSLQCTSTVRLCWIIWKQQRNVDINTLATWSNHCVLAMAVFQVKSYWPNMFEKTSFQKSETYFNQSIGTLYGTKVLGKKKGKIRTFRRHDLLQIVVGATHDMNVPNVVPFQVAMGVIRPAIFKPPPWYSQPLKKSERS